MTPNYHLIKRKESGLQEKNREDDKKNNPIQHKGNLYRCIDEKKAGISNLYK
jgi:hypothetical protein